MTDIETLVALVKAEAPLTSCVAVLDQIETSYRNNPASYHHAAAMGLARALVVFHRNSTRETLFRLRVAHARYIDVLQSVENENSSASQID